MSTVSTLEQINTSLSQLMASLSVSTFFGETHTLKLQGKSRACHGRISRNSTAIQIPRTVCRDYPVAEAQEATLTDRIRIRSSSSYQRFRSRVEPKTSANAVHLTAYLLAGWVFPHSAKAESEGTSLAVTDAVQSVVEKGLESARLPTDAVPAAVVEGAVDPTNAIISVLLTTAFVGLTVLTLGVAYLNISSWLDQRNQEKYLSEFDQEQKARSSGDEEKKSAPQKPKGFG